MSPPCAVNVTTELPEVEPEVSVIVSVVVTGVPGFGVISAVEDVPEFSSGDQE